MCVVPSDLPVFGVHEDSFDLVNRSEAPVKFTITTITSSKNVSIAAEPASVRLGGDRRDFNCVQAERDRSWTVSSSEGEVLLEQSRESLESDA